MNEHVLMQYEDNEPVLVHPSRVENMERIGYKPVEQPADEPTSPKTENEEIDHGR